MGRVKRLVGNDRRRRRLAPKRAFFPQNPPLIEILGKPSRIPSMLKALHRLILALTALAFLSGASLQAMPVDGTAVQTADHARMVQADMPCASMGGMKTSHSSSAPCKGGITVDCIKQMGCIGIPDLPQAGTLATPVAYTVVSYRLHHQTGGGLSLKPDLFPPIAV
jgi:hypothetical protein